MKQGLILLLSLSSLWALSQDVTTSESDLSTRLRQERERLSKERIEASQVYSDALKGCYQIMDVNNCKAKAQGIKNKADNHIRRQEIELNQLEREQRTQDAQARLRDKQSPENIEREAERRERAQLDHADTVQRNQDKNAEYQDKQSQAADNLAQRERHVQEVLRRQDSHADKAAASDKARADYQRKLLQAQEHRNQVMKDRAKRSENVDPLPAPPAKWP